MITVGSLGELARHGCRRAAVACGVFDGVHRGHQRVVAALLEHCQGTGALPVMLTFEPHPRAVLAPANPPPRLTLPGQKLQLFAHYGAKAAIIVDFDARVAALSPTAFLDQYLLGSEVVLEALCVGRDWRFGCRGAGDVELLRQVGQPAGFAVIDVDELWLAGVEVGSTAIRRALGEGDLPTAAALLGRPYAIIGEVGHGKGLGGERFGCPTANIVPAGQMLPADGVYAVRVRLSEDDRASAGVGHDLRQRSETEGVLPGIAYVGSSPTLGNQAAPRVLEAHLFDFAGDLYGRSLAVEFVQRLRPDQRFPSVDLLAAQIQRDIETARTLMLSVER